MCRTWCRLKTLRNRVTGCAIAQEYPQAFLQAGSSTIERIDGLYARPHLIALHFRRKEEENRVARLETIAVFGQPFRENDRFKMSARVRKADDAHLAACARAALDARNDGCRNATSRCAGLYRACELRPRLHAHLLQHRGIVVEGVAGQEEADGFILAAQALRRQPGFDLRQHDRLAHPATAKQLALPDRRRVVCALRARQQGIDGSEYARAIFLEGFERACSRKAFEDTFVHGARINASREIREVDEGAILARHDNRLDRLPSDALERGKGVDDRIAIDLEVDT